MIRPALQLTIGHPSEGLRFTVQPSNLQPFAIHDGCVPVAWAASQTLANRIAGFLNWRDQMEAVERRYSTILHA